MRIYRSPGVTAHSLLAALVGVLWGVCASGAGGSGAAPDHALTPGDTLPVTVRDICTPGYSKLVRNVPEAVKRQVYAEYGIAHHKPHEFEVDHLISLELGGSNSLRNLWPESYLTQPWNAHVKDTLENRLHADVCSGALPLADAQHEIATDWIAAYKRRFGASAGKSARVSRPGGLFAHVRGLFARPHVHSVRPGDVLSAATKGRQTGSMVWVNLRSGVYWERGSLYYGKTKSGKYLSEAAAVKAGYRAAKGY